MCGTSDGRGRAAAVTGAAADGRAPDAARSDTPRPAALPDGARTLVVDRHELVGWALARSLQDADEPATFYPARQLPAVLDLARSTGPGLLLLELHLGRDIGGNTIDAMAVVSAMRAHGWRVVLLTGAVPGEAIGAALAGGAFGWIPKTTPFAELLTLIAAARRGGPVTSAERRTEFLDRYRTWAAVHQQRRARLAALTARERTILHGLADGRRAAAIAGDHVVSVSTVRNQIRAILGKLEVHSQVEAVVLYRETELLPSLPNPPRSLGQG